MWNLNHCWLGILFAKRVYKSFSLNGRKSRFILIIIIDTVNAFMSLCLFCFNTNIDKWSSLLLRESPLCFSCQFCIHFFSTVQHPFVCRALLMELFDNAGFRTTLSNHCKKKTNKSKQSRNNQCCQDILFGVGVQIRQLRFHHVGACHPCNF